MAATVPFFASPRSGTRRWGYVSPSLTPARNSSSGGALHGSKMCFVESEASSGTHLRTRRLCGGGGRGRFVSVAAAPLYFFRHLALQRGKSVTRAWHNARTWRGDACLCVPKIDVP
eukprot:583092-Prorocentrum_minimum.AAC.1